MDKKKAICEYLRKNHVGKQNAKNLSHCIKCATSSISVTFILDIR